jgi:short-subunit dehydrogenase
VALVTGASSGIGAAVARELAARGVAVGLAARRLDRLEGLAGEIRAAGGRALPVACDVSRDGDPDRAAGAVREAFGPISIVVANAGFGVSGGITELGVQDFQRQYETNLFGVVRTVRVTLEDLTTTRGVLAILGSVAGYFGVPGEAPYCSSKAAVRILAQSLWGELRPVGVGVVLVSPGYVESEIRRHGPAGRLEDDPVPRWLIMPSERAAAKIVRAIVRRRPELILTAHGCLGAWLARLAPSLLLRLVARSSRYRALKDEA